MFREKYKKFIDQTQPNRELIKKIYEKAEEDAKNNAPSKIYKFSLRYGAGIAAVLVLSFSALLFTQLNDTGKNIIVPKTNKTENIILNNDSDEELQDSSVNEAPPSQPNKESYSINNKLEQTEDFAYAEKTRIAENSSATAVLSEFQAPFTDLSEISENESQLIYNVLKEHFGEKDPETQNEFIFELVGKFYIDNEPYYLGRWRWFVVSHSSLLCEFVLKGNLLEMYECRVENNNIIWQNENNLLS